MPARQLKKLVSLRLPEAEFARYKALAASRGITFQEAIQEALEHWAARPNVEGRSLSELRGTLRNVDLKELRRHEREAEFEKERRWL